MHYTIPQLAGRAPVVTVDNAGDGWQRVRMVWRLDQPVQQDELAITFPLDFEPDFWWAPHLAPRAGDCIAQHVFRSPALIAARRAETLVIIPDLDICGASPDAPWFLDIDAPAGALYLGLSRTTIPEHVRYQKTGGMVLGPGEVTLGFFYRRGVDDETPTNPWRWVNDFLWQR
ncbi:MAG: hypothetical protein KJZ93_17435, partial [Caldilineaceae bacterium]|nr:hypothetical protein [Caldilineaceae bacterium]